MPISRQSVDFLFENHARNSRDWFKENRDQYKTLVEEPLLALAAQLMPTLLGIDPLITADPKRCLSRIFLDMRRNHSGMYFRDHMWLAFRRGKGMFYPSYYFEFSPRGYSYGVGYYSMPTAVRNTIHQWVLHNDKRYLAAQQALDSLPQFEITGEEYRRKKFPAAPPSQQPWLNRKSLSATTQDKDAGLLFSPQLGETLARIFKTLAPLYQLFLEAHLLAAPGEEPQR